ncbi:MAG TPA: translation initiation factor IF-2 subunit gamma [Candidatus Thermoplasmatota archaeon]|nr:translation initiation factor IF-2 subunit gamma [Candidatus Thermoplasmatota archaeon]
MKVPKQPEVNIGMIGHVDHGKTTLTQALTGEWTDRHSEELKRGISIKLGYADTAIYKCSSCAEPQCWGTDPKCSNCSGKCELARTVSFVDAPGHETLMATMLNGASLMDGALLVISAAEPCPQPQTREHLMALTITGVKNIVIVQNKIDLVPEQKALENYEQIKAFVKGTIAEKAPIIPVSAQQKVNIDVLLATLEKVIPTPEHDLSKPARMYIARSFDTNLPGSSPKDLKGGVIGGSLIQGNLNVGDEIEILPGRRIEEQHGKVRYEPLLTKVTGLVAGGKSYKTGNPGGLIGVGTLLDPAVTKSDSLGGRLCGKPGTLPPMLEAFTMEVTLLDRVVGTAEDLKVDVVKTREPLMLNIGTATTVGVVTSARGSTVDVTLKLPVCAVKEQRVALSRRIGQRWRLIGYGVIR